MSKHFYVCSPKLGNSTKNDLDGLVTLQLSDFGVYSPFNSETNGRNLRNMNIAVNQEPISMAVDSCYSFIEKTDSSGDYSKLFH